ncbi:hypothetical protein BIW53_19320 [Pseudoalteromonas byunsanensis]|uniref:Uncharacterized protein n=1 Tax=Pseudoalteromonas byunsanensis TaxID=327939 RepID=A0A1S1N2B3_9GAMM|nr:hypothetical protein BIW53_19320 [Pseudoalteromonas byunsanensis]
MGVTYFLSLDINSDGCHLFSYKINNSDPIDFIDFINSDGCHLFSYKINNSDPIDFNHLPIVGMILITSSDKVSWFVIESLFNVFLKWLSFEFLEQKANCFCPV